MENYNDILPSGGFRNATDGRNFWQRLFGLTGTTVASTNSANPHEYPGLALGPNEYKVDEYKIQSGQHVYKFGFKNMDSFTEIDILESPSYGNRSTSLHDTHRLSSARGGYKICFGDESIITDLPTAKQWAASWAELTSDYIINGNPFPNV